jgi:RNA polymerase sigma-70 factor (family 1)
LFKLTTSFESLYNQFKDEAYNTSLSYLHNPQDAEEITQDVFVEVFKSLDKFKGESNIGTWIYRITVNKSLDFLRHKKRKKRFAFITSIFDPETGEQKVEQSDFIHPGVELEQRERSAALFKAIDKLPANQKTAFILSKIEGLSYAEISEVMNTSISSIESQIFRAKKNLKKILSRVYDELF